MQVSTVNPTVVSMLSTVNGRLNRVEACLQQLNSVHPPPDRELRISEIALAEIAAYGKA